MIRSRKSKRGFTLVELLVCISIFVIMTALLVIKYGNFNQNILLTNLAYDTALAIRTAQNFGLSVKSIQDASGAEVSCDDVDGNSGPFLCAYGVAFTTEPLAYQGNNQFILFADKYRDQNYDDKDPVITTYTLKNNAIISAICAGSSPDDCNNVNNGGVPITQIFISFKRPDPNAIISDGNVSDYNYTKITIQTTDGSTRSLSVRANGQISVDI